MRTTIVPAQITTVEDRIAGNLGLSQILLLVVPIFGGSALFVILPPFFNYATYKVILIAVTALVCGMLAVRIKGKILLFWGLAIARYNLRPMYYVFDKCSMHTRECVGAAATTLPQTDTGSIVVEHEAIPRLSIADRLQVETVLSHPTTNVHFTTTKKGALRVHLTENQKPCLEPATN